MAYYLTVISGADEGRSCEVEGDQVLIGRSPQAQFPLKDDSIAWEHAVVRRENGRVLIDNLAAGGTRVRGKRITTPTRLAPEDEIELSPTCRLLFIEQRTAERPPTLAIVMAAIVLVLLIGGAGAYAYVSLSKPGAKPMTTAHWRTAYTRLGARFDQWSAQGLVPERALARYRNAWRLEQVGLFADAATNWEELNSILLTLSAPAVTGDDLTMAESASHTQRALNVIMGYDPSARHTDFEWNRDDAYADALVWFVRKRAVIARKAAQDAGQTGKKKKRRR